MERASRPDPRPALAAVAPSTAATRRGTEGRSSADLVTRWLHLGAAAYLSAVVAVAAVTGGMLVVRDRLGVLNVALIYLLVAFAVALLLGPRSATLAAVLSFAAYNFFFLPPYYSFRIQNRSDFLLLLVYLIIVAVTGQLVARIRVRTEAAERERRRTGLL